MHKSIPDTSEIQSVNSRVSYFKLTIELKAINSNNGIPIISKIRAIMYIVFLNYSRFSACTQRDYIWQVASKNELISDSSQAKTFVF